MAGIASYTTAGLERRHVSSGITHVLGSDNSRMTGKGQHFSQSQLALLRKTARTTRDWVTVLLDAYSGSPVTKAAAANA